MREFGDLSGVVVNVKTGNVIGGHQRLKHLDPAWEILKKPVTDAVGTVALGYIDTPFGRWQYREVDWDEKREKAANVAANKHGGEFDVPLLKDLLIELDDGAFDLKLTGFSQSELEKLINYEGNVKPEVPLGSAYEVIVTCADESEQKKVFDRLTGEGMTCRVLSY